MLQKGRVDEAITQFQIALEIQPDLIDTPGNLGKALFQKGRVREALAQCQKALELQPDNITILSATAWVLATWPEATARNGARAMELAQRANKLANGRNPLVLQALAAAFGESGRFAEAVTAARRALQLAEAQVLGKSFCDREYSLEEHVEICHDLEEKGSLPASFMLFPPVSRNKDIWTDIVRMKTLNKEQSRRNEEMHVCPLQLDVIQRLITRYTNKNDVILDPFAGIGSVPYQAIKMGRRAVGVELNAEYWRFMCGHCERIEAELTAPTLFDLTRMEIQRNEAQPA